MFARPVLILLMLALLLPQRAVAEVKIKNYLELTGRIAFSYTEKERTDIYILDFDGPTIKKLVGGPGIKSSPKWSPDGQYLAYDSDETGDREIFTVYADGSRKTQLTNSPKSDQWPSWSSDSMRLAFESERLPSGSNIFVMDRDGSNQKALTDNSNRNIEPAWSPRQNELLYVAENIHFPNWDIVLLRLDDPKPKRLSKSRLWLRRPAWSPDGSTFMFSYGIGNEFDIWLQEKGSRNPVRVTSGVGREFDIAWSDDSRRIAYTGEITPGSGSFQLFVRDLETNQEKQLLEASGNIRHPTWTSLPEPPPLPPEPQVPVESLESKPDVAPTT